MMMITNFLPASIYDKLAKTSQNDVWRKIVSGEQKCFDGDARCRRMLFPI